MMENGKFGGGIIHQICTDFYIFLRSVKFYTIDRPNRRNNNKHNHTTIKSFFDFNKVNIGNYTYGPLDIRIGPHKNSYINIGNYCSIAPEVEFICGQDHTTSHMSNYPLGSKSFKYFGLYSKMITVKKCKLSNCGKYETLCRGSIIVDDDVRIGTGAKIMSGVHIGQGAVIAAGAIVTKDIPPYAIAGGVPAKVIKYRFPEDKIKKLLQIDYSNIPIEKFREIYPETIKEDFDIDYILEKLKE